MENLEDQIIVNNDNTVFIPFGRVVESYILHYPLLKNTRLKSQSRLQTSQLINQEGTHLLSNIINANVLKISRIISCHADHQTIKGIKGKLLASFNGTNEEELNNEDLKSKGYILYYQQPDLLKPEDSLGHYYQLTISNKFWLQNGRKFEQYYFRIVGKYDLNIDHAPVLTMVVKNSSRHGTSLAFGLSNKKNNWTICLAVTAVKKNIPCTDPTCKHSWHYEDLPNAGHLPNNFNSQNPMTTNNYTERMNCSIESQIKLLHENLHSEETNKNVYEAGLVTLFNAQSIKQLSHQSINNGAPSKLSAKPYKSSYILHVVSDNINNEISSSEQKQRMMNIRKAKHGLKGKQKENDQLCFKKSKISAETFEQQPSTNLSQVVIPNIENHIIIETDQLAKDNSQEYIEKFNIACQHVLNIFKH
ncbi:15269_t:CDS:2 [Cetraspora pellucida]|uniref:15269_t:CDS:1 n=1 Tax=Cetraspora pellucida TaxID=1433469 RepID=A0A9N9FB00_9GLOM|nr:15269_t:CDS:2 [Cetraspora pellucida]